MKTYAVYDVYKPKTPTLARSAYAVYQKASLKKEKLSNVSTVVAEDVAAKREVGFFVEVGGWC